MEHTRVPHKWPVASGKDKDQTGKHGTCKALTQPSEVAGVCWPCPLRIPVEESVPQNECKCEYEYEQEQYLLELW